MKISCEIIKDILPLYVEKMTSKESNLLVEEHIKDCNECANALNSLQSNELSAKLSTDSGVSLKFVQKRLFQRKIKAIIFVSLIVFLAMFTIFSYLTKPSYISLQDSNITFKETQNQDVYANFSDNVTSYSVNKYKSEDGKSMIDITAWTSTWDKLIGKSSQSIFISTASSNVNTVYYCDYTADESNNMTVVYGKDPNESGGVIALQRFVLGYYFIMAVALLVLVGVVWLILWIIFGLVMKNKQHMACKVCKYIFFVPFSYLLSNLLLTTSFVTFSPAMDFVKNVIATIAIYPIFIVGISLIKQNMKDRTN